MTVPPADPLFLYLSDDSQKEMVNCASDLCLFAITSYNEAFASDPIPMLFRRLQLFFNKVKLRQ